MFYGLFMPFNVTVQWTADKKVLGKNKAAGSAKESNSILSSKS